MNEMPDDTVVAAEETVAAERKAAAPARVASLPAGLIILSLLCYLFLSEGIRNYLDFVREVLVRIAERLA